MAKVLRTFFHIKSNKKYREGEDFSGSVEEKKRLIGLGYLEKPKPKPKKKS